MNFYWFFWEKWCRPDNDCLYREFANAICWVTFKKQWLQTHIAFGLNTMIRFWKIYFFHVFFFILWNCPLFILFAAKISSHVSTIVSDIVVALKKIYNIVWKVANRKMHFDVVLPINYNLKNHLAKWLKKVFFFFLDLFEYSWANKKFCLRQFRQSTQSYWLLYAIEFYLIWPSVANSTHLILK